MTGFYTTGEVAIGLVGDAGAAPVSTVTGVTVSPSTATLAGGAIVDFDWVITGANGPSQAATVTTTLGTINSAGVLTAPAATSSAQAGTVTVTSAQDPTKSGTATFTVSAAQAGDTTAPTLTAASATAAGQTTATGTVTTNEAGGTLYGTTTASATATASQVQAGISKAVTAAGEQAMSFTGLPAGATLYPHYVHVDASGNVSAVANGASFTTQSAGDTTGPVMQGELIASKTSTTTTITVPVATDASGIGEYFFAIDGGAPVSNGSSRTKTFTGLAPLTPHLYEVTATDTLGNPSGNSLSITVVTDAAGDDPSLVTKNIQVTLKGRDLSVRANAAGINWEWSDARGVVTSSGTGLVGSASGVLTIPIRTRLLSDGVGRLSLDNYNGGNILTYLATQLWVRLP